MAAPVARPRESTARALPRVECRAFVGRLLGGALVTGVAVASTGCEAPKHDELATMRGMVAFGMGRGAGHSGASGSRPAAQDTILILPEEGPSAKLPRIGLRLTGVWPEFVANRRPVAGTYVSLAGPPPHLLMFVVKGYFERDASSAGAAELFRAMVAPLAAASDATLVEGEPTRVELAGGMRAAVAFRVDDGDTRSDWCVAMVPSNKLEREGLVVAAGIDAGAADADCAQVLAAEHIAPLAASLALRE